MVPGEFSHLPLFSYAHAVSAGLTSSDLRAAVNAGELARVKRGWYTAQPGPWVADRHASRVLAELSDRPGLIPSHYSAAAALGLPVHRHDWTTVHLMRLSPGRGQRRPGLVIHRWIGEVTQVDRCLAIAQTALCCPISGLMALDNALRDGEAIEGYDRWVPLLSRLAGARNLAVVRRLADGARESPLESWTAITLDRLGWSTTPQHRVPGTPYRADARLGDTRVLIECDGRQKYEEPGAGFREKMREDEIRRLGWEVVRVTGELLNDPATLNRRLRAALELAERRRRPGAA